MYLGNWSRKKVLTLAPDVVVFINGNSLGPICLNCGAATDFREDITNVSINASIEQQIPTATISIKAPRSSAKNYYKNGRLIFSSMQEVEIAFKGRFLSNKNDLCNPSSSSGGYEPRYYTVFWGFITDATEDYGAGEHTITLSCAGMLRWWEIMLANIHPTEWEAQIDPIVARAFGTNFFANKNPFQIIYHLAETIGLQAVAPLMWSTGDIPNNDPQDPRQLTGMQYRNSILQEYWRIRFKEFTRALKMYGWTGNIINSDTSAFGSDSTKYSTVVLNNLELDPKKFEQWTPFFTDSQTGLFQSQNDTRLNCANTIRDIIGYEFFQDTTGQLIFKPPFYNLDVRTNYPISVIEDLDVINWSFTESEANIVTGMHVYGNVAGFATAEGADESKGIYGWYVDYNLARKYGYRQQSRTVNYLGDGIACHMFAISEMSKNNLMANTASITIPGRPELRLGYPIYIHSRDKDEFWYLTSIQHAFQYGGSFTTTLGLAGVRRKFLDKNNVLGATNITLQRVAPPPNFAGVTNALSQMADIKSDEQKALSEYRDSIQIQYGNIPGVYDEVEDPSITRITRSAVPVSDACGYEHIGGWEYGRGLALKPTGEIATSDGQCTFNFVDPSSTTSMADAAIQPQTATEEINTDQRTSAQECTRTTGDMSNLLQSKSTTFGSSASLKNPNQRAAEQAIDSAPGSKTPEEEGCACRAAGDQALSNLNNIVQNTPNVAPGAGGN